MLQKIVVVIVGLVMSVVGALTPDALFATTAADDGLAGETTEELLSTLRTSDGQAFARISVLWVEVDGRRVSEDAWGTGEVEEMRFKVGVKDVDDAALAVGDKIVDLHPTDIITVRMFRGDFSYRGVGTALASVQLQGSVKTTVLKEGDITNRVLTTPGELDLGESRARPSDEEKVAYVVLTTGEKVDTVAVEDGGSRLFTQESATADDATSEAGNLLAKWVKIDGKLVREYTWGDGVIKKVEFEPAEAATRSVVLTYNDEVAEVAAGERVVIEDFVGEYLIYQVSGGMTRLRLDGYSASFTMGSGAALPAAPGVGDPFADFAWAPISPKSTDTVQFTDNSSDDGIFVFRQWDFGDGSHSVALEDPTHRFAKPGPYEVTLTVTDNDLRTSVVTRNIIVRNAQPVPDFDFAPKVVTTQSVVAFSDLSFDTDGNVTSYSWDFGDGETSSFRNPSHTFDAGGTYTVTLSATDDLGVTASISKIVVVRNAPPTAAFTYATANGTPPVTLEAIQFVDTSDDADGDVVRWNWSFGDNTFGAGSAPTHAYARPGVYTITLTAYDDKGDADSLSTTIFIGNRAPFADFVWMPLEVQPANVPLTFTSTSTDEDGLVLLHVWDFGDGTREVRGGTVTHTFPREGVYNVTLTVTDNGLASATVHHDVHVANSAPRANFGVSEIPTYRDSVVTFTDRSTDPDNDGIVHWTWEFGDNSTATGRVVDHSYDTLGTHLVTLTVTDSAGTSANVSRPLRVLNRPPTILASMDPRTPDVGQEITFSAQGDDPDVDGGLLEFEWTFSDGFREVGSTVKRTFNVSKTLTVSVRARDQDGGVSNPVTIPFHVEHAKARVDFSMLPTPPVKGRETNFTSLVVPAPDATITGYEWRFGFDDTSRAFGRNASYTYPTNGFFNVTLKVIDDFGVQNETTKMLYVNLAPEARFALPGGILQLNTPYNLTDESVDRDGVIESWLWEYGDGASSTEPTPPPHAYAASGAYPVNLTVTDDRGTSTRATKVLEILNKPPAARFTFSADPEERLVPFLFDGSGSSDPDEQPISTYTWNFGDGAQATGVTTSHVFERSGFHQVGLRVTDAGGKPSEVVTGTSHLTIRVGASHDVLVHVTARYAGGRPADLSNEAFRVTASLNTNPLLSEDNVFPNGTGYDIIVPKALWLNESSLRVRIQSALLQDPFFVDASVRLFDDVPYVELPFDLELRMTPSIRPYHGQEATVLGADVSVIPLAGSTHTSGGDAIYREPLERPRGAGTLAYADGEPASGELVHIFARWVPLKAVQGARDTAQLSQVTNGGLLGWCPVDQATSLPNGTFEWEFDATSACVTNNLAVYPAGRWEVYAAPASDLLARSPARAFYVDPTGGLLVTAASTLA